MASRAMATRGALRLFQSDHRRVGAWSSFRCSGVFYFSRARCFSSGISPLHRAPRLPPALPVRCCGLPAHALPAALNGFGLWNVSCCSSCSHPMCGNRKFFALKPPRRSSTASTWEGDMPAKLHASDRPWRVWPATIIVLFVVAAALLGFDCLAIVQSRSAGVDAFARSAAPSAFRPFLPPRGNRASEPERSPCRWLPGLRRSSTGCAIPTRRMAPTSPRTYAPAAIVRTASRLNPPHMAGNPRSRSITSCMTTRTAPVLLS